MANKVNNSIGHKITKRFTLKSIESILSFNLIIIILFVGYIFFDANRTMESFANTYSKEDIVQDNRVLSTLDYTFEVTRDKRNMVTSANRDSFRNLIMTMEYNYLLEESDEEYFYIKDNVGKDLNVFKNIMIVIMVIELVLLFVEYGENRRAVRKLMLPLEEIIATAQVLNQTSDLSQESLKKLAVTLDSINATHLETRLPVETSKTELRALSVAINDMLDRIDKAYSSQSRFVSDASHELRTPIAIIQSYASLLDRWGLEDVETAKEAISAIKSEAESMKNLVEQLLFLARGDSATMIIKRDEINLGKVASQSAIEMEMIDKSCRFEVDIDENVMVLGDLGLIKQLIRILMDNSIKYTPSEGEIKIKVYKKGDRGIFQIQDQGQGISGEDLPQVFDRFYRTDKSRNRSTGGSGLGLSIGRWIAEKHGGHITILSREGIGTRIEVDLPTYGA